MGKYRNPSQIRVYSRNAIYKIARHSVRLQFPPISFISSISDTFPSVVVILCDLLVALIVQK